MKISIIIPAYNEEKRISKTLEEYGKFFTNLKNKKILDFEIIVVLNGCKDKTEEIVKKLRKKYKEINYLNFAQLGKGFAIIEGFKDALKGKNDLIGFVDADMATSPEAYYELIKNIKKYDGIIGSRYLRKSIVKPKQSVLRIIFSRIFNFIIRSLFFLSYKDTQCGAKIFKKEAVKNIIKKLGVTEWAFDIDLLCHLKKQGFKIKEYPTVWADKEYSKINFSKVGPRLIFAIIRLRLINSFFEPILRLVKFIPKFMHKLISKNE